MGSLCRLALLAAVLATSTLPARPAGAEGPAFPLKVSADGHYLVDQKGKPFLVHGDSPWESLWRLTREETLEYLDRRMAQGFNTVLLNLLPDSLDDGHPRTPNRYGVAPFRDPSDFSTANAAYFDHADWYIAEAGKRGLLVTLFPCYLGINYTWIDDLKANGVDRARAYGQFLGARFGRHQNLVWIMGGDRDPGDARAEHDALAESLFRHAPHQLITFHGREHSSSTLYHDTKWLAFNFTYSYSETYTQSQEDWRRTPPRPSIMSEAGYEREANDSRYGTPQRIRRQAYWTLLAGSAGHFYGSAFWHLKPGWREHLDWPGARQMKHVRAFFLALPWWDLVPGFERELVAAGNGYYGSNDDYITAAATPDRRLAALYMPVPRRIKLDLSSFPSPVKLRWFDPTTGAYSDATQEPLPNQPAAEWFWPPPREADGDWALVLEAVDPRAPRPPAVAAAYHELRVYHVLPGKAEAILERFSGKIGELKRRHGLNPVATWLGTSEDGRETVVVELLAPRDAQAAEVGWKAFYADPEASEARHGKNFSGVDHLKLVAPQSILELAAGASAAARTFDLRIYQRAPGKEDGFEARWRNHAARVYRRHGLQPLGWWEARDDEHKGAFVTLMAIRSPEALQAALAAFNADGDWLRNEHDSEAEGPLGTGVIRYVLRPASFSGLR
jgi:heme-degrading monooxygenase HmoA